MDQKIIDNATQLLKVCRLKLMNISELRLFGCVVYKFNINLLEEINLGGRKVDTACCTIVNKQPTIYFNINHIEKEYKSFKNFQFDILHELLHFLNHHLTRGLDKDPYIYNIAGDHVINRILLADANGKLSKEIEPSPNFPYVIFNEIKDQDMTTDEVYDWLMNNKVIKIHYCEEKNKIIVNIPGQGTYEVDPDVSNNPGQTMEGKDINEETKKQIESTVNEIKAEIRAALDNNLISRGTIGSNLYEFIDKLTQVEIPWDKLVENCINSTMVVSPNDRSWKNINRRMAYYNHLMPYKGMTEKKDNLYIVIDTSGSISNKDLSKFCYIIEGSLNHFDNIKIIQHDYKVTHVDVLNKDEFVNKRDEVFQMHGRGGTSHDDAFKLIEEDYVENEPIGMIISLTDYESDIESIWDKYKWKDEIPFKVILTSKHKVDPRVDKTPIYIK